MKQLIVNADDFGFTRDVNAGIVHAHRNGILTSTTLMANGDAFDDAVRLAHETPTLDVGCHLVLVQGTSLRTGDPYPEKLTGVVGALATRRLDAYAELRPQIEKILAAGIRPTHLDTHKHTHVAPVVFRAVVRLAHEFGIPYVRLPLDAAVAWAAWPLAAVKRFYMNMARPFHVRTTDHFLGFRLTGSLDGETLAAALENLPEGLTEFMCHPGFLGPELQRAATRLKESRVRELEALTSRRIRELVTGGGIHLRPFRT
ncbi:MAG: ChbG/HpnK family deacetylase [Acidobacteriaceae bacterium]|nr:ChbG/HpnK family deacetylase [Acidobacteriaceae bacterium]MBV8571806.1 ChbG/HpnK family deacetylase [Acidobacteriaceae bacterium]